MGDKYRIVTATGDFLGATLGKLEYWINQDASKGYKLEPKPDSIKVFYERTGPDMKKEYHAVAIMYKDE